MFFIAEDIISKINKLEQITQKQLTTLFNTPQLYRKISLFK